MVEFMRAGGVGMWAIAAFGLTTLVAAMLFLWRPDARRLDFIRAMSRTTLYSTLVALSAGVAATLSHVALDPDMAHPARSSASAS
jgi:hypothetical protein